MKLRLTIKEVLLFAGILVALAAVLLYWTDMPVLRPLSSLPSHLDIVPYEVRQLISKTFSVLR